MLSVRSSARGVLAGKHRRALDSSILDDAVVTQDTVAQIIAGDEEGPPAVPEAAFVPLSTASEEGGKPVIEWSGWRPIRGVNRRRA
jgi:hypothetical protein